MRIYLHLALVVAAVAAPRAVAAQGHDHTAGDPMGPVELYQDLGDHHYTMTTKTPDVQAYFDQGLRLYYGFNHAEAVRSFKQAQLLEPSCAMCWWGEALALGPNINLAMDTPSALAAFTAIERALEHRATASEKERALIEALAQRYEAVPADDRSHLDAAYAAAMGELARRYPDDTEIAVLYAESIMDLMPWDYWENDGTPRGGMEEALALLTSVQAADPRHPGGCHFFIHAVEQLYPERAIPCAERLAALMPGAGHIVHMPGHIYIRVGRYADAIRANEHAVHADETFIQDQRPGTTAYTAGYYPHNYDFLAFAAMMVGDEARATEAASQVKALIPEDAFGQVGMDFLQHWSVRPLLMGVRFEQWDRILATPAPPAERSHSRAIWHYARGRAAVGIGDLKSAREHLAEVDSVIGSTDAALKMEFNQSADLLTIAREVLAGWIQLDAGDAEAGVTHLRRAVDLEDGLLYGEPPEWTVPVRQELGSVLLRAGLPGQAAAVFREDLERFPNNRWSTEGLAQATAHSGS